MIAIAWVGLALVVGYVGDQRGRSGVGLFLLSIIASPIIGRLVAIALPVQPKMQKSRGAAFRNVGIILIASDGL